METPWHTATQCHYVLSSFLTDIQRKASSANTDLPAKRPDMRAQESLESETVEETPSPKRQRTEASRKGSRHDHDNPLQSISSAPPRPSSQTSEQAKSDHHNSFEAPNERSTPQYRTATPSDWFGSQPGQSWPNQSPVIGSAYGDSQGFQYQASEAPVFNSAVYEHDPGYWGNFNYNMEDIFESAIFENLPGQYNPPMASGWNP